MNILRHLIPSILLLASAVLPVPAQTTCYRLLLDTDKRFRPTWEQEQAPVIRLCDTTLIARNGQAGYDLLPAPRKPGEAPFFVSVSVPDGNYLVTVTIGSYRTAGHTTVRAESRRLMIENIRTHKGELQRFRFTVNKRNACIAGKDSVRIKPRERSKLNWDDKLTLEFNGERPLCASIEIRPADKTIPTVFLCGNSTVVDQDEEPWASWGQMIPRFFTDSVCFANYAESGETAASFIAAGRLRKLLSQLKPGDYVVVEFGHNDQKLHGPGVGAYYSFATRLKEFIDETHARGAVPILVTPTRRRAFRDGKVQDTHADYPEAVCWVAGHEHVALIDLQESTRILLETLGTEGSKRAFVHYPAHTFPGQPRALADNTHFNPYGAYQIAKCVVEGMKACRLPLIHHLRTDYVPYSPAHPDSPDTFQWSASPFTDLCKPDGN